MDATTVILGLGNSLLSDEGVGVHAISHLQKHYSHLEDVSFLDGGTLSFTLAVPLQETEQLIVIDAAELGSAPGTVQFFEDGDMDSYLNGGKRRSVHEVGLVDLMAVARLSERLPRHRALIGIQPKRLHWGESPTEAVAAAIPQVCLLAVNTLERWRQ